VRFGLLGGQLYFSTLVLDPLVVDWVLGSHRSRGGPGEPPLKGVHASSSHFLAAIRGPLLEPRLKVYKIANLGLRFAIGRALDAYLRTGRGPFFRAVVVRPCSSSKSQIC
jgi:hypothetical protein